MPDATAPGSPEGHGLLAGRKVVVTAAAGTGIGFSTAVRLAKEGATVCISDHHERRLGEALERLNAEAPAAQGDHIAIVCNVTDEVGVQSLFAGAVAQLGGLDVVVNNAGLGGEVALADMTDDQWNVVIDVTLTGTMRCTRAAVTTLRGQGGGIIINNASVLGWRAQPGQSHYAAAKAGVMALTRCVAVEEAPNGIRVNAVAPSLAMHPFLAKVTSPELLTELEAKEAYGRAATVEEIANVIAFLASDYSTYMTGEIVSVSSQRA